MKTMMFGGAAAIMGGGLYAAGAFDGGEVYNLPVAQAYAKLEHMPMPPEFKDIYKNTPGADVRVDRVPMESVTWHFTEEGHEMATFRAELSPEGEARTRVAVSFRPGDDLPDDATKQISSTPLIKGMAEIAMSEQVDSQLEGRPFDKTRMALSMATYVATHQDEVKQYMTDIHSVMERLEAPSDNAPEGVAEVKHGGAKPMTKAQPMTDLSKYNN